MRYRLSRPYALMLVAAMIQEDPVVSIGRRIRTLRMELGLSQEDLADAVNLSRVNLSRLENGKAEAGFRTLLRIAKALDMKLSELVEGLD